MRRRMEGITRPRPTLDRPTTEFEVDGPLVHFRHTTIYGHCFEASAPRDAGRQELAAAIAMGLHLAVEDAFALADEVRRRIVATATVGTPEG